MSQQVAQEEAPPQQKTPEQLEEQLKAKQQEERLKQEERKKVQEEARLKAEQDLKKMEDALKGALSQLGKTSNNQTMAFNRLSLAEKQLQKLFPSILRYQQIRFLDLNSNTISDLSIVVQFKNLVWLNVSKNQVPSLSVFSQQENKLERLQILNISGNKIKQLCNFNLPCIKALNLNENQISQVTWKGHAEVEILELRKNKLRKLKNICNMKKLKELYVCQNELTDIRGLQNLPNLNKLSIRNNKIKSFMNPFPSLPGLAYFNFRQNHISKIEQLKKIETHINRINFLQNPLSEELGENTKKEVIWVLPHFIKINKSEVTLEDRVTFEKQLLEKQAEKQRERLEKEAAEKPAEQEKQ